jgi:hypothetical protein
MSWAAIAKRLIPEEYQRDRAAARERIRKGAHHYEATLAAWLLVPDEIERPLGES